MFIDEADIYVKSGKGGDGMVHFHREKYVSRGGPDGGDGGRGGDIIFEVIKTLNSLSVFRQRLRIIADDGRKGGPNNMTGRSAEDTVIKVPPGTLLFDRDTNVLLGDMVAPGDQLRVCKGGRGGRGNSRFATAQNQAPRTGEKGEPAEEKNLRLELKLIADVGIVGVPNAGKSSLLAAVTNAKPKIANYPFTTLEPNLGVVELNMETTLVLADIPGLIEGAHMGVGLGDSFLRHIQRTKVIIHLLDGESDDPLADFTQINNELALFDSRLGKKQQIVALNKADIPEVRNIWPNVMKTLEGRGYQVFLISAMTRENLNPLLWKVVEMLSIAPELEVDEEIPIYRPEEDARAFTLERETDGWRVKGTAIERSAAMTYWEYEGSVRRFQKLMETLGVEDALRKKGIENGDTVHIGDYELEWQD